MVPFQNVSLKGILVKFCPSFSAFSGRWRGRGRKFNSSMNGCNWDAFKTDAMKAAMGSWDTSEDFTQVRFGFVQRNLPIFVTDAHLCSICHKILEKSKTGWCQWHLLMVILRGTDRRPLLSHQQGGHSPQPLGLGPRSRHNAVVCFRAHWQHLCLLCTGSAKRKRNKGLWAKQSWSDLVWAVYRDDC